MTPTTKTTVRDAIIGGVVTIVASLALMAATGAWSAKEDTTAHATDIATIRADLRRVIDAVCYDKPSVPVCQR